MTSKWGLIDMNFAGFDGPPARTCRFIPADPQIDPTACGTPSKPGSSYCEAHHARCYRKPEPDDVSSDAG